MFFEIGLLLALGILLFAFEWKSESFVMQEQDIEGVAAEEEEAIPITQHLTPPPPPPPPAPKLTDLIEIVEDDLEMEDELELEDVEDDTENTVNDTQNWSDFGTGEDTGEGEIFVVVEDNPIFPEGNVTAWINKRIKYPTIAQENGITGRVIVKFVIEKDGSVTNVEVLRGVDPSLDKEAVRVINLMPKWRPGKQRGRSVRVAYTLPIIFQLN